MAFRVALTFDAEHPDRPARPGNDDRMLDTLEATGTGRRSSCRAAGPRRTRESRDGSPTDGHLVGSHTFYHARMPLLSHAGLATDMRAAEAAITRALGVDPRPWFRCPFGAGALDPELLGRVADAGYPRHAGWHVDTEDWQPGRTADELTTIVVDGATRRGDGAVVLMHSWPDPTAVALPEIVRQLGRRRRDVRHVRRPRRPAVRDPRRRSAVTAAILAVDGGNSKTDVALVAADGRLLAAVRGPSTSHQAVGMAAGMKRLVGSRRGCCGGGRAGPVGTTASRRSASTRSPAPTIRPTCAGSRLRWGGPG